ncbi:MAG: hypothetical protein WKF96_24935 [Solirubrobacteraceae bacterium]
MRKLIVIPSPRFFRDFITSGAFDAINDPETYYVTAGFGDLQPDLTGGATHVGQIGDEPDRKRAYNAARDMLLTAQRVKSPTRRMKLAELPLVARWRAKLAAMPGWRHLKLHRIMRDTGLRPEVHELMKDISPELVITVSAGHEALGVDVLRSAKELDVPSLTLTYNWDNLSSKAAFLVDPDNLGVIGHQSAEHAERIHGLSRERVTVIGSPYIDHHFRHEPGSTQSPFDHRYVVFAGCYRPFDELRALELLDEAVTTHGLALKIVYLPHFRRVRRARSDFIDEGRLRNVIVEPRIHDQYIAGWKPGEGGAPIQRSRVLESDPLPLEAYPGLLENAEFVVCPLSTIMLEAAILGRRVLAIAYHDGLHRTSPGYAIKYLHFEKVDDVETFEVCRAEADLVPTFAAMAADGSPPRRPPKDQMDYWIYHDTRPFSERLAELVERLGRPSAAGRTAPPAAETMRR